MTGCDRLGAARRLVRDKTAPPTVLPQFPAGADRQAAGPGMRAPDLPSGSDFPRCTLPPPQAEAPPAPRRFAGAPASGVVGFPGSSITTSKGKNGDWLHAFEVPVPFLLQA